MAEQDPKTTQTNEKSDESAAHSLGLFFMEETTTAEHRKEKTFTYVVQAGHLGVLLATSRRVMRDMPNPTETNPGAMTPTEMESIGVMGGYEVDGKRECSHFTREFVPPLRDAAAREFAVHQLSCLVASSMIVTTRALIEHATAPEETTDEHLPPQE